MSGDTESLINALETNPVGTFKIFKGTGTGVERNINVHLNNMQEVQTRIDNALANNCYIEVLSLRIQVMDYWLRIYFVNKSGNDDKRKREFGALLDQCKELGLDSDLYKEIDEFNKNRVKAIHGFVVGLIRYNELEEIAAKSRSELIKLILFVIDNCGEVISKLEGMNNVGDAIFNVPHLKNYYHSRLS